MFASAYSVGGFNNEISRGVKQKINRMRGRTQYIQIRLQMHTVLLVKKEKKKKYKLQCIMIDSNFMWSKLHSAGKCGTLSKN